jgi:hypothetical protein
MKLIAFAAFAAFLAVGEASQSDIAKKSLRISANEAVRSENAATQSVATEKLQNVEAEADIEHG